GLAPAGRAQRTEDGAESHLADGLRLRVRCVSAERFAAAWLFATGSETHLRALQERAAAMQMALDEVGLHGCRRRVPLDDEPALYAALNLPWVPPELREDADSVSLAAAGAPDARHVRGPARLFPLPHRLQRRPRDRRGDGGGGARARLALPR